MLWIAGEMRGNEQREPRSWERGVSAKGHEQGHERKGETRREGGFWGRGRRCQLGGDGALDWRQDERENER